MDGVEARACALLDGIESVMRVEEVLQRIQGEYLEMPGLRLTAAQARRLWGLDHEMCVSLLAALVDAKFLRQTRDGSYIRSDTMTMTSALRPRRPGGRAMESVA
jgi:hypothetical protein